MTTSLKLLTPGLKCSKALNQLLEEISPWRRIKCLDGEKHGFEDCPYVNPEKRTTEWKPDPEVEKKFEELEHENHPKARKLRLVKKQLSAEQKTRRKSNSSSDTKKKADEEEKSNFLYDTDEYCGAAHQSISPTTSPSFKIWDPKNAGFSLGIVRLKWSDLEQ